jgi:hypothetical protein
MPYRDRATRLTYWKARYRSRRKEFLKKENNRYRKHRRRILKQRRLRYRTDKEHAEKNRQTCRLRNRKLKAEVISAYGGKCTCCSETLMEFLTIDHIGGGGRKHIYSVGGPAKFYGWLKANKFPDGFRVLCFNCNSAIGFYGYCPHQKKTQWSQVELNGRVVHTFNIPLDTAVPSRGTTVPL